MSRYRPLLFLLLFGSLPTRAYAQDPNIVQWTGGSNGLGTEWATASNWLPFPGSPAARPTASQVAYFNNPQVSTIGTGLSLTDVGQIRFANSFTSLTLKTNVTTGTTNTLRLNGYQGTLIQTSGSLAIEQATSPTVFRVDLAAAGNIDVSSAGSLDIRAPLTGTSGFTKTGSGALKITDATLLSGTVTVQAGTLRLGGSNYTTTSLSISGGTLDLISGGQTLRNLSGTGGSITTTAQSTYVGVSSLTIDQTADTVFAGTIQQASNTRVALTKSGTGTLTLTGNNTYTGGTLSNQYATTISGGDLQIGNGGTSGSITGSVNITGTGKIIYNRSDAVTVTNNITSGSMVFMGGGTFTHTGTTFGVLGIDVEASTTLLLSGTKSVGHIDIKSGGVLGGAATLQNGGNIYMEPGSTFSPGAANQGTALFTLGNLNPNYVNMPGAKTIALDLNGTTPGTQYDQLAVNGSVRLTDIDLLLSLGFVPDSNDSFFVIVNDGTDAVSDVFTGYTDGATVTATYNGIPYAGRITYTADSATGLLTGGNDVALYGFAATVPEPATLSLILGAPLALCLRRRRLR